MKTIYKYPLNLGRQVVLLPLGARVLTAQVQHETICLWAEVADPEGKKERRTFNVVGTGHPIPNNPGVYIGTVQMQEGRFVWHVYEERT